MKTHTVFLPSSFIIVMTLALLIAWNRVEAKGVPETSIMADVKSVEIGDQKIVIVLSGKMHYFIPNGDLAGITVDLDNATLSWSRNKASADLEAYWDEYSWYLRKAAGMKVKFRFPRCPEITYGPDKTKITALSTMILWIENDHGSILTIPLSQRVPPSPAPPASH